LGTELGSGSSGREIPEQSVEAIEGAGTLLYETFSPLGEHPQHSSVLLLIHLLL
jgi:hypothetical protein